MTLIATAGSGCSRVVRPALVPDRFSRQFFVERGNTVNYGGCEAQGREHELTLTPSERRNV